MINDILSEIQARLKAPKSQFNAFGKYNYRNCEDILEAVKPILAEYKATITLSDSVQYIGDRYYVRAVACLGVGDEEIEIVAYAREEETKKGMDGSQITGASSSYARKYALNGLFAIDDTKDSDTTNVVENKPKTTNAQKNEDIVPTNAQKKEEPRFVEIKSLTKEQAFALIINLSTEEAGTEYKNKSLRKVYEDGAWDVLDFLKSIATGTLKEAIDLLEDIRNGHQGENK